MRWTARRKRTLIGHIRGGTIGRKAALRGAWRLAEVRQWERRYDDTGPGVEGDQAAEVPAGGRMTTRIITGDCRTVLAGWG
jgi:hypothetical protein